MLKVPDTVTNLMTKIAEGDKKATKTLGEGVAKIIEDNLRFDNSHIKGRNMGSTPIEFHGNILTRYLRDKRWDILGRLVQILENKVKDMAQHYSGVSDLNVEIIVSKKYQVTLLRVTGTMLGVFDALKIQEH